MDDLYKVQIACPRCDQVWELVDRYERIVDGLKELEGEGFCLEHESIRQVDRVRRTDERRYEITVRVEGVCPTCQQNKKF